MKKVTTLVLAAGLALVALQQMPAYAASGKACFESCKAELTRTNGWNRFPRGYCRQQCNYYRGAPADVLRSSGRVSAVGATCLSDCRSRVRAQPQIASGDRRYCKKQCGVN